MGNNPLQLSAAEVALCEAAPNPTAAAIAILSARDPRGYALRPDAHRAKTRELADKLRAWAATLTARPATLAGSTAVLDLRGAVGRNRTERAMSALALEDKTFDTQPLERRIALASQALRTRRVVEDAADETRVLAAQGESAVPPHATPIGEWPAQQLPSLAEIRALPPARGVQSDTARVITWMTSRTPAFAANSWSEQVNQAAAVLRSIYAREPEPQPHLRAGAR